MNDAVDSDPDAAAEGALPVCGERLVRAREEQQIRVGEIAKELHLDEAKVLALEVNDFADLGAPVFAKGYLRKYAELVDLPFDDILLDYHKLTRADGMPPVVGRVRKTPREFSPLPLVAIVVLVAISAGAWSWFGMRADAPATVPEPAGLQADTAGPSRDAVAAPARGETRIGDAPVDEAASAEPASNEPVSTEPVSTEPGSTEPGPAGPGSGGPAVADSPVAAGDPDVLRLQLAFSGECWTEVTDAAGRRLFFGLGAAGRTVDVSGDAPLNVLLGDADNVEMQVNGEDVPVPPAARRGRTARLTLAAD